MAIERNDVNMLNDIQIKAENNRRFFTDVRSICFFTKDFAIEPTFITKPQDVIDLKVAGLDENHEFYKLIQSAYTQPFTPVVVVIYGNNTADTFTKLIETYKKHEKAFEVTNWVTNMDAKANKTFVESIVTYAKTDKEIQVGIALDIEKLTVTTALEYIKNANADNVAFIAEGNKNVKLGNYLTGAIFGGTIGTKIPGSYIVHSTEIHGFVQETYSPTEQVSMKNAGLSYLSKPTQGYFHVVGGFNSDNKKFTELNIIKIWLQDRLKKDVTVFQVTTDKIPNKDSGKNMLRAIITADLKIAANMGMLDADNSGNVFGTIVETDKNGNKFKKQLGSLYIGETTQESSREGTFDFDLNVSYLNGARFVKLRGIVTTEGKIIFE